MASLASSTIAAKSRGRPASIQPTFERGRAEKRRVDVIGGRNLAWASRSGRGRGLSSGGGDAEDQRSGHRYQWGASTLTSKSWSHGERDCRQSLSSHRTAIAESKFTDRGDDADWRTR